MSYPIFDRSRLIVKPLSERQHDMDLSIVLPADADVPLSSDPNLKTVAERVRAARRRGSAVILMMGAHVIKVGMSRFVIALMEEGWVTHVAMNGAGPIHDYELALVGASTESVARYIRTGEFGLWRETGHINEIASCAAREEMGLGEAVGQAILEGDFPHRDVSILAAGCRLRVPVTAHIGIGYDIIHEHPNCDGAALGAASYQDFLVYAESVYRGLEGGVLLNFGTAVMGPEVYLKALSMARNLARQEGRRIASLTTAVFDLPPLSDDFSHEPPKDDPRYYYRPWKTILTRTVADGGESFYIQGDHRETLAGLYRRVREEA
ncbi:MAG: hypothetical protein IT210_02190 [Armatimonadetes bacterium]|nr:hypothetical protein [Armatimonadota bacterium]